MKDISTVLNDESWVASSAPVEDLAPEFAFLLKRTVYVGDPNSIAQLQNETYNRAIRLPDFGARDPLRPSARDVLGREAELAAYYRQMMEITGRGPGPGAVGYWLSLEFVSSALDEPIRFPWWDRVEEATELFSWVRKAEPESRGYLDCDQGWFFKAELRDAALHFQYGDLDTGEVYANTKCDRAAFVRRLEQAELDIRKVIGSLRQRLAIDPWS